MKIKSSLMSHFSILALTTVLSLQAAMADSLSPKDTYLKYRTVLASATKIDDVSSYMSKEVNEKIKETPADMKPMMFDLMKATIPKDIKVLSEEVKGDSASIALAEPPNHSQGKNISEVGKGDVTFVKEDGSWKIKKERWEVKVDAH